MPFTADAVRKEMTASVKEIVEISPGDSVKERLRAAARHIGMPFGRVQDYLYGEVRCPPAHEADQIRSYYRAAQELIEARNDYEQRRQRFLRNHPNLARFVPGPLENDEVSAAAEVAAGSKFGRGLARKRK